MLMRQKKNYMLKIITPHKHDFYTSVDESGKHQYEEKINFSKYMDSYNEEEEYRYDVLRNILRLETKLNAIFSYEFIHHYNINTVEDLHVILERFKTNLPLEPSNIDEKIISGKKSTLNNLILNSGKNEEIYITLKSISFSQLINLIDSTDEDFKLLLINRIMENGLQIFSETEMVQYIPKLRQIVMIRNACCHNMRLKLLTVYDMKNTREY